MNPLEVGDSANSQTLSEQDELRLRVLAELDTFMHCSNDVLLTQELVRDELPRFNSDSECDASSGDYRGFGHDFRLQWFPLCSDSGVGDVEVLQKQ